MAAIWVSHMLGQPLLSGVMLSHSLAGAFPHGILPTDVPVHRIILTLGKASCNRGPVFGIRKALLFSDFERRKKGLLWNFLRNLSGQLRYRGFAFYRLGI
ncbi:hypothetical protein JOQ06_019678 [Pogonophryne albipinna]|uniref:Uncharacterized protein n=1 Tax=Pogonophryne albipinna TaxID=1090488 RepID=A0AAD6FVU6_9TELE|nr:hypothetical protein JOQ06_019678 [Pogonophryne albipinna]